MALATLSCLGALHDSQHTDVGRFSQVLRRQILQANSRCDTRTGPFLCLFRTVALHVGSRVANLMILRVMDPHAPDHRVPRPRVLNFLHELVPGAAKLGERDLAELELVVMGLPVLALSFPSLSSRKASSSHCLLLS